MGVGRVVRTGPGPVFWPVLLATFLWAAWRPTAGAAADRVGGEVRPLQARGRQLLQRGIRQSPTFSGLVDAIAQSDVVVYVDLDPYDERRLDGALNFVGTSAGVRYVKVWLCPRHTDAELIVTLAHELQHALEIAESPAVVDQRSLARLYLSIGQAGRSGRFETHAAQDTAVRVAVEVRRRR